MPANKAKPALPSLSTRETRMLGLVAAGRLLPWDPAALVKLQALGLISKAPADPDWSVTPVGRAWLESQSELGE